MNNFVFEAVKGYAARAVSSIAETVYECETHYLPKGPVARVKAGIKKAFVALEPEHKNRVYGKVWELAKMQDNRAEGHQWGAQHVFDDLSRLATAMQRLGLLKSAKLHPVSCLPHSFGEGGMGSRYFSLERTEPKSGQMSMINGMGVESCSNAIQDTEWFSSHFADGHNIHGIYHSSHKNSKRCCSSFGPVRDMLRMKAVNGGSYTKTSYLAAQQIIDYLENNPRKKYLQIGVSEGAAHVNAALRLIQEVRPKLLSRICVILLGPAYFIMPEQYDNKIQVMSFVKKEDGVINPWGTNTNKIGASKHITVVPHENKADSPHSWGSEDFQKLVKPYVDRFITRGTILQ
jgi:hypothetical protein